MREITIDAKVDNLHLVTEFLEELLEEHGCSMSFQLQLTVAVEEMFVNIANYAYGNKEGKAVFKAEVLEDPKAVRVTFTDFGIPFDPLKKADPDVTLPASMRAVGGLGIYMAKKNVDRMDYCYEDGKNILTMVKKI